MPAPRRRPTGSLLGLVLGLAACAAPEPKEVQPSEASFVVTTVTPRQPAVVLPETVLRGRLSELEEEDRYPEAIEALDRLLDAYPGLEDAEELHRRRATLEAFVRLASESYVRAEEAETAGEELAQLELIHAFWPGYRDVALRLELLRDQVAAAAVEELPDEPADDPESPAVSETGVDDPD